MLRVFRDSNGRVWVEGLPDEQEMYKLALENPEWYLKSAQSRIDAYTEIVQELESMQSFLEGNSESMGREDLGRCISNLASSLELFYSYVHLGLLDDLVIDDFVELLHSNLAVELANQYLNTLLRSDYAKVCYEMNIAMSEDKGFNLGCTDYVPAVKGTVVPTITSALDSEVESVMRSRGIMARFSRYRDIVPTIYQLGQENLFVGKPLLSTASFVLTIAGRLLVSSKQIPSVSSLTNLHYQEIVLLLYKKSLRASINSVAKQ
jgi:hypothetical protein